MHHRPLRRPADGLADSPPSAAQQFALAIQGKPIPQIECPEVKARAHRQTLEQLARVSPDHAAALRRLDATAAEARREREALEWAAKISPHAAAKLLAIEQRETADRAAWRQAEDMTAQMREEWDESKHPRVPAGQRGGGQWSSSGGGFSSGNLHGKAGPVRTATHRPGQSHVTLVATGGAADWPVSGSITKWIPRNLSGAAGGVRAGALSGVGALFKGFQNASMIAYWERVSGVEAMPSFWVYELEKRARAGNLSHDDAVGIFGTGLLDAEAQGFKPTGRNMTETRQSMMDFLAKAEQVYFARKKEQGWATQPQGYQQSGGKVFPTEHNSGLKGAELRQEQEGFFERGLAGGNEDWYLRGQAANAGLIRRGTAGTPADRLEDPEIEAALQRAIKKAKKQLGCLLCTSNDSIDQCLS